MSLRERARAVARSPTWLALLGGTLFALGGPPFPAALAASTWIGVALLALIVDGARPMQGALRGLVFGLSTNLVVLSFIPSTIVRFTDVPLVAALGLWLLLSLGQAFIWAVCGLIAALFSRRGVPLPLAMAFGVAASMFTPQLFSWTIATPLARAPIFLQLAEVVGERGVAIAVALFGAYAALAWRARDRARRVRASAIAMAIPLGLLVYGLARRPAIDARLAAAPRRTIGLVQHAVPPKDRWRPELAPAILTKLWDLTRRAQDEGAELAIWPEAAYPYVLPHEGGLDAGAARVRGAGIDIEVLTGLLTEAPPVEGDLATAENRYNAATIVTRDGRIAPASAKLELLPFGEAVPFGDQLPALRRLFARSGSIRPGKDVVLLASSGTPQVRAGVLNCYEDTLPAVARKVAGAGPNLIVNVTNDAWFGTTSEPELHLIAATARAIETRRDVVRAVNTGVTAHLDAFGRIVARADREAPTVLIVRPALLDDPPTPYVRFGDATWGFALVAWLAIAAMDRRARRLAL